MLLLGVLEIVIPAILLTLAITQVFWPLITGQQSFPIFRAKPVVVKNSAAEADAEYFLEQAKKKKAEVWDWREKVASRVRQEEETTRLRIEREERLKNELNNL